MANKFRIYQQGRTNNYNTIDRIVKNYVDAGGVLVHCYPLLGYLTNTDELVPVESFKVADSIFNENSRRRYSKETFEMYGVTTMNTPDLAFGLNGWSLLDADEITFSFHYNSMVDQLGRKLIVGDVLELTFLRDLDVLGVETGLNKFYTITSSMRDEKGWAANYKYHLWKVKCKPMPDSPEYSDLINNGDKNTFYEDANSANGGGGYDSSSTNIDPLLTINDAVLEEAEADVSFRLHNEHHIFLNMPTTNYKDGIWVSQGIDGIPNDATAEQIQFGTKFPESILMNDGDYFLRIDNEPPLLFQYLQNEFDMGRWEPREYDLREKWTGVPAKLRNIINNNHTVELEDGEVQPMRQNIKDLVKAKVKKEHNNPRPWDRKTQQEIKDKTGVTYPVIGIKTP